MNEKDLEPEVLTKIKSEASSLKSIYNSFFDFNIVLTSNEVGKTCLNISHIDNSHEEIILLKKKLLNLIEEYLNEIFTDIREHFVLNNEDEINNQILNKKIKAIEDTEQRDYYSDLIIQKDKLECYIKILEFIDISKMHFKISLYDSNDLIDSKIIFENMNFFGLLNNQFEIFYNSLFKDSKEQSVNLDFRFLDGLVDILSDKYENYNYKGLKNTYIINYINESEVSEFFEVNRLFLEAIIVNLIEQSCHDIINNLAISSKTEDFYIDLKIEVNKKEILISICNQGRHLEKDTELIIQSKNYIENLNGKFEHTSTKKQKNLYLIKLKR